MVSADARDTLAERLTTTILHWEAWQDAPEAPSQSVESSSSPATSNKTLVEKGVAAWNKRDWESALEDLAPAVEWNTSGVLPELDEVYYAHDGVRRFWRDFTEIWEDIRVDIEELVERADNDVVALARFRAHGRDGVEVDRPVAFQFVSDQTGSVTHFYSYWNRADAPLDARTSATDLH